MKKIWAFEDTVIDLDKVVMIKSYQDDTIAITFQGNDKSYRFGPLSDGDYATLMDEWTKGGEE